jgi:hypothetical protein
MTKAAPSGPDITAETEAAAESASAPEKPEKEKVRQIPAPVQAFLDTHALPDRYTLVLGRRNSRSGREETLQTYTNYFPDVEEIGRDFGTGDYFFIFSFYNRAKSKRDKWDPIDFVLAGDHFETIYTEEKDRRETERLTKITRGGILDRLQGQGQQNPLALLKDAASLLNEFGGRGNAGPDLTPLAEAIKAQGENFRSALETMNRPRPPMPDWLSGIITTAATAVISKLVDKLTEKKGEEDPMGKAMDKLISLGEKFGMFKELASPKEPDKWDRLITLAEVIFNPLMDRLMALPPAQRKNDPAVKMITSSKDFKELMNDPDGLKKFMTAFYEKFGARRTVIAMEACGLTPSPELKAEADKEDAEEKNAEGMDSAEAPGDAGGAPGAG